ncbi:hypothetical protein E2562_022082 [Oryza meyeriana var. granulata]|uniref:Uncharacterized protein n=1 Tax=Oryza meyeriana var. granulata TaxID=110450 RepID=A0A6G1ENQ7_9ORYZ|nr:hypothetical protein E2562_022082 [Oryza meyeriana var. granulata]
MEDFVNEYYSVEKFKTAYKTLVEPLPDKSQWPTVDLSSQEEKAKENVTKAWRLAVLIGEGTSSQPPTMAISTPTKQATPKKIAKKITPKKMKKD